MSRLSFTPNRLAAQAQLSSFVPQARHYAEERNFVRPDHPAVAGLSPWLQKRQILESEVVAAILQAWSFPTVEKFIQEVYWRTYWKGWLEHCPGVWDRWREAVPRLQAALPAEALARWEQARAGTTGIAGFDDWARELVATGYLHNHARMWFASIWIHTLRLPWELGAAFFYEYLLDGDVASNTLSWRWVAGLQTPGKTYLARADNIAHYTEGRSTPAAHLLASAPLVLTEEPVAKLSPWVEAPLARQMGAVGDARERVGLWLHPEDLAGEVGELAGLKIQAIYAGWPKPIAHQAGWGDAVTAWTQAALQDGAHRAGQHFAAPTVTEPTADLAQAVTEWAIQHQLKQVVAYYPFVGPWRAAATAIEQALAVQGITMVWRRRAWDVDLFPHATRGFFPFWQKISERF